MGRFRIVSGSSLGHLLIMSGSSLGRLLVIFVSPLGRLWNFFKSFLSCLFKTFEYEVQVFGSFGSPLLLVVLLLTLLPSYSNSSKFYVFS